MTQPISSPKVDLKRGAAATLVPLRSPCVKRSQDQHALGRPRALLDSLLSPTCLPDLRVRRKQRAVALNHKVVAQFVKQKQVTERVLEGRGQAQGRQPWGPLGRKSLWGGEPGGLQEGVQLGE